MRPTLCEVTLATPSGFPLVAWGPQSPPPGQELQRRAPEVGSRAECSVVVARPDRVD